MDNGNIRIKLNRKEINVNDNRIKPFILLDTPDATPQKPDVAPQPDQQPQQLDIAPQAHQQPETTEEQPWIQVERKKKKEEQPKEDQAIPKRGRGRPRKNSGPPKDKVIQMEPRWTRLVDQSQRAQEMLSQQKLAQMDPAQI
jgi:hypothetical protein